MIALLGLVVSTGPGLAAPVQQENVLNITSPTEGAVLSGEVAIQGTATHPNFNSYGVLYAPGAEVTGSTDWQQTDPIAWNQETMVVNGVLGTWDTTQVPNGTYVLALVMWEVGSNDPQAYFVNNITVNNEEATPTPEPTATPEPAESEPEATAEEPLPPPSDAPSIEQPATATPQPTPTLDTTGPVEEDEGDGEGGLFGGADLFSVEAVKEAFTLGVQLAFLMYAAGILYVLAKAVIRYYLRQTNKGDGLKGGGLQGPGSKEPTA
jgi:hypothetical protein